MGTPLDWRSTCRRTGRSLVFIPIRRRGRKRVHDEDDDTPRGIERRRNAEVMQCLEHLQGIQDASHAEIIRYAAIDQMDVRPSRTVGHIWMPNE